MTDEAERYWIIEGSDQEEVDADTAVAFTQVMIELGYSRALINGGVRLTPAHGEGTIDVVDTRCMTVEWRKP